jgi:hypothetical protein
MSPPLVVRILTAMFTLAVLYGFYVATLIHCLRWLAYTNDGWKLRDRVDNKLILITTILIFSLSTVYFVLMLPIELSRLGHFSNHSQVVNVLYVCKYHGWRADQKND